MKYLISAFVFSILIVAMANCESHDPAEIDRFPNLMSRVRISGPLSFCGEIVPLENQDVRERFEKELLLALWDRPQIALWIKRSGRYLPIIEKLLKINDMPDDLKYVAIIESALRPHAGSHKGAVGFWQFIKTTGRKYGLEINSAIDQRRNIFFSTQAAIDYFKDLYDLLGSWTLAAAAYNMGEQGVQAEILAQNSKNYYHLYLPLETQRYVLRIVVAKMILSEPQSYGFQFTWQDLYPPLQIDRLELICPQETPIAIVARAAGTSFKRIKDLNPEIRGHFLAPGSYRILVPEGAAAGFLERFESLVEQWRTENNGMVYVVRTGDSLSAIAKRFNVPLSVLITWNRLNKNKPIHPGDRLVIYMQDTR